MYETARSCTFGDGRVAQTHINCCQKSASSQSCVNDTHTHGYVTALSVTDKPFHKMSHPRVLSIAKFTVTTYLIRSLYLNGTVRVFPYFSSRTVRLYSNAANDTKPHRNDHELNRNPETLTILICCWSPLFHFRRRPRRVGFALSRVQLSRGSRFDGD